MIKAIALQSLVFHAAVTVIKSPVKAFSLRMSFNLILHKHQLPLIVVDTELEEITQWIN